jgi:short-subunit dehydrogenase
MSSLRAKSYDKGITLYSTSKNSLSFFAKNLHEEYSKFKIVFKVILLGLFKGGLEKKLSKKIKQKIMDDLRTKEYSKVEHLVKIIENIIQFPHKTNVEINFLKLSNKLKN